MRALPVAKALGLDKTPSEASSTRPLPVFDSRKSRRSNVKRVLRSATIERKRMERAIAEDHFRRTGEFLKARDFPAAFGELTSVVTIARKLNPQLIARR
jgi:hypothetical protein